MSKLCKSCGNYYDGDYCDKCGYGKEVGSSKAAAKYKKATKPERFRTDEDKEIYAKWEKEKREAKAKSKDPNANVKFLIVVAVVVVVVILFVLYQSGVIFSNTRKEVVEQYFSSIEDQNYDDFIKCFPKEIKNDYDSERRELGLSKEEYMSQLYADFEEAYGEDYTIELEFGKEEKLESGDYDMTAYKETYGTTPSMSEVYEIVVNVTFSGSKGSEDAKLYVNVAKTSGYWRIFNITQDNGIVDEETGIVQQEAADDGEE